MQTSVESEPSSIPISNPSNVPSRTPAKRVDFVSLRMVRESSVLFSRRQVRSAEDAVELVRPILDGADREQFVVAALDTKHRPTKIQVVSVGSLDCTIVHPREVFKIAVLGNASGIICFHNHPSGDPTPSSEDIAITKRLCEAGRVLGIEMLDHIAVGSDGSFETLRGKGLMGQSLRGNHSIPAT